MGIPLRLLTTVDQNPRLIQQLTTVDQSPRLIRCILYKLRCGRRLRAPAASPGCRAWEKAAILLGKLNPSQNFKK